MPASLYARSASAVEVRVTVPPVWQPPADPGEVRRVAAFLGSSSERVGVASWQLGASSLALAQGFDWCGPAASAFSCASGEQQGWLTNAAEALNLAGSACQAYAHEIEGALAQAHRNAVRTGALEAERDQLVAQVRRVDAQLAAAPTTGPGAVGVFSSEGAHAGEVARLQAWADQLEDDAKALSSSADQVAASCRAADARASAVLDQVAAMTLSARLAARTAAAAKQPHEDGSVGSRVGGFFSALGEDVAGPAEFLGGLAGLHGGLGDNWAALGQGLGYDATHPKDWLGTLIDLRDIKAGNWGRWVGTVGPAAVATYFTAGGYAGAETAAEAADAAAAAEFAAQQRLAQQALQRLLDEQDYEETARFVQSIGGRDRSTLVPGGGLMAHQLAGGHLLDKHVGLSVDELRRRSRRELKGRPASAFTDRATAEQAVAEVLERSQYLIKEWLGNAEIVKHLGTDLKELELEETLDRPIGLLVHRSKPPVITTSARAVLALLADSESLPGYYIKTGYAKP
jgi:Bacterial CdiA-CT RNAse A domain